MALNGNELPFNGDVSEISTDDEDDEDWLPQAQFAGSRELSPESSDIEDEEEDNTVSTTSSIGRRHFYLRDRSFRETIRFENQDEESTCQSASGPLSPIEYFRAYISEDFVESMALFTNCKHVQVTGNSLNVTKEEMATFIGINFAMSITKFPRIRMYWERMTRFPLIADIMPRDRFFKLRSFLKVVDDNSVTPQQKKNKLWKVKPILDEARSRCMELPRPKKVSIDESMIPFRGRVSVKQHVPGKPNPDGLKMFVLASPRGLVLDFEIFQGKDSLVNLVRTLDRTISADAVIGIGEAAVLRFIPSVNPGTSFFFDRYFTSTKLLVELHRKGFRATGTIKKNMLPKDIKFKTEKSLKQEGRGASDIQVRNDRVFALTAWQDKKVIYLASSEFGVNPQDACKRWSKAEHKHINISRPLVVQQYNSAMGGVDVHDQIISYYRSSSRTRKWTVRVILHILDFVTANCWLEYRSDSGSTGMDYLDFKLILADQMIRGYMFEKRQTAGSSRSDHNGESSVPASPSGTDHKSPLPAKSQRTLGAMHLPVMCEKFRRCRNEGCIGRARTICSACKAYLCLNLQRNCFFEFHV